MNIIGQIAFSLISKSTKSLIISLKIERNGSNRLVVDDHFKFYLNFQSFFIFLTFDREQAIRNADIDPPISLAIAGTVHITFYKRDYAATACNWRKDGFSTRNWIDHVMSVFHSSTIKDIEFHSESERVDWNSLKETINGLRINSLVVASECTNAYYQLIMREVKANILVIVRHPQEEMPPFQINLMENSDAVQFTASPEIRLNDLLSVNCKAITLAEPSILTVNVLNRFLKLWKTGSNTRLRYLNIYSWLNVILDVKDVLRGIKHKKFSEKRNFETPELWTTRRTIKQLSGGYDIQAVDGRKASIFIENPHRIEVFFLE